MPINKVTQSKLDKLRELGFKLSDSDVEREPTDIECLLVTCPTCNAVRNESCVIHHIISTANNSNLIHRDRRELAKHRVNSLAGQDKALIIQYAYLGVCASVAANSDKLLGKIHTPEDIEAFFVQAAIKELKEAGYFNAK